LSVALVRHGSKRSKVIAGGGSKALFLLLEMRPTRVAVFLTTFFEISNVQKQRISYSLMASSPQKLRNLQVFAAEGRYISRQSKLSLK
jgi:hypothetical protein